MRKFHLTNLLVVALVLFMAQTASAQTINWAPPSGPPLGNNVPAPINVGDASQVKTGSLSVGEADSGVFATENESHFRGLTMFEDRSNGNGSNFLVSFIASHFLNDVTFGNSVANVYPDVAISGRFQYLPRLSNGGIIHTMTAEEAVNGGFDRALLTDEDGNVRWTTLSELSTLIGGGGGGGGIGLPLNCADNQIAQYDLGTSTWGCADLIGGGGTLPNGTNDGQILRWNNTTQAWEPTYNIAVTTGGQVLVGNSGTNTVQIGIQGFNGPQVKIPLNGTAAAGKVLTATDNQGTLGWAAMPTNPGGGDLPAGVDGQVLRFNGGTNAWEATSSILFNSDASLVRLNGGAMDSGPGRFLFSDDNQGTAKWNPYFVYAPGPLNTQVFSFLNPDNSKVVLNNEGITTLRDDVYMTDLGGFTDNQEEQSHLCIDTDGADNIPGNGDDGKVYECKGEDGFIYVYPGGQSTPDGSTTVDPQSHVTYINTNNGGTSRVITWTVPDDIYFVDIRIASGAGGGGGGGAGQVAHGVGDVGGGGAGGGGGGSGVSAYLGSYEVTPGQQLCLVVGEGGDGAFGVSRTRNRALQETISDLDINNITNKIQAKSGQNGGNSFVAVRPVAGCQNVTEADALPGTTVAYGGQGGHGGSSTYRYQSGSTIYPDAGAGGLGGFAAGGIIGVSGTPGVQGYAVFDYPHRGEGGTGGQGGQSGTGVVATGGKGGIQAPHAYTFGSTPAEYMPIDINLDNTYSMGTSGQTNPNGEEGHGPGDRGKNGTTHLGLTMAAPGGGAGGGGASTAGMEILDGQGNNFTTQICDAQQLAGYMSPIATWSQDVLVLDSWMVDLGALALNLGGGGLEGLYDIFSNLYNSVWPADASCEDYALYTYPYYRIDIDGNGNFTGPNERWQANYLGSSYYLSNIENTMASNGYNQAKIDGYLDNMCATPYADAEWNESSYDPYYFLTKIRRLTACGGSGGNGGDGFVYISY